jgi:hypothetical protein
VYDDGEKVGGWRGREEVVENNLRVNEREKRRMRKGGSWRVKKYLFFAQKLSLPSNQIKCPLTHQVIS